MALPHSSVITAATRTMLRVGPIALIRALFHSHCIFVKDLHNKNAERSFPKVSSYILKAVRVPEQVDELPASTFLSQFHSLTPQEIKSRVGTGSVFFCVYVDSELAHMSWLVASAAHRREIAPFSVHYPIEMNIELPFTDPNYRRLGLFSCTLREMCRLAAKMGKTRVFMATLKSNEAAVASLNEAGFQVYREGPFWRLFLRNLFE